MFQDEIGIKISNNECLNLTKDGMVTYYSKIYCEVNQSDSYVPINFRCLSFYVILIDAQYKSLIIFFRYLTAKYNINRIFLAEKVRLTMY